MSQLAGKVAWVTGAESGLGEAAALALADAGATVVLTGRRVVPHEQVAHRINITGTAHVQPADLSSADEAQKVGTYIRATFNRLDILVNNAGLNIVDRHWDSLTPTGIDTILNNNLTTTLYCVTVALPFMRDQGDGLLIHTASMAGRFIGGGSGPIYTTAKHGIAVMSHGLNMQECIHGIRSTVFLPSEVATLRRALGPHSQPEHYAVRRYRKETRSDTGDPGVQSHGHGGRRDDRVRSDTLPGPMANGLGRPDHCSRCLHLDHDGYRQAGASGMSGMRQCENRPRRRRPAAGKQGTGVAMNDGMSPRFEGPVAHSAGVNQPSQWDAPDIRCHPIQHESAWTPAGVGGKEGLLYPLTERHLQALDSILGRVRRGRYS